MCRRRIAALEGIGEMTREAPARKAAGRDRELRPGRGGEREPGKGRKGAKTPEKAPEPPARVRGRGGMDLGL